ncbi:MAG: amino acid ABC transporter permease [Alphaproteobacteria bacterium]|nr:amino acid ABC transporter permease [Alphaproteobacteria bacterium]
MFREFAWLDVISLLRAAQWTILLSLFAFVAGGLVGLAVALARVSRIAALRYATIGYINLIQGTPFLIQLLVIYFGLTFVGIRLDAWSSAAIALTLYTSAFLGEIWRGCIQGVPATQWEAAEVLGLSHFQKYLYVILPQALLVSLPATVGFLVQIVKATSLLSVIGFAEIMRIAQTINNVTFQPFIVYGICAVLYFLICLPLSRFSVYLERRLHGVA